MRFYGTQIEQTKRKGGKKGIKPEVVAELQRRRSYQRPGKGWAGPKSR